MQQRSAGSAVLLTSHRVGPSPERCHASRRGTEIRREPASQGGLRRIVKRSRPGVLLIAFLLATPLHALDLNKSISQFTHTSWSAKDGIPGPVRAIAQTADGYLWLGSDAGLYRFDGLRFVPWQPITEGRLPDSPVLSLLTARDGSLWVGFGSGGISQIRDERVTNHPPGGGVPTGGSLSIVEDGNGSIWAGGPYGLARFDGLQWHRVGSEAGYTAPGAQALLVDHQGTVWVATDGSNFRLSKDPVERNTILSLALNEHRFSGTGEAVGMVWRMAEAPGGRVWIADTSRRRVRPISARTGQNAGISFGSESMCLTFDREGALWVGLIEGGLRRIPDLTRPGTEPLDRFEAADGLSDDLAYTTFEDREGNIWFGTAGGLDRFRDNKVTPFSAREGVKPDQQIALTATPDGSIWFFSYTRDAVRRFREGHLVTSRLPKYSPSDASRILSLYADENGHLLVGGSFKLAEEIDGQFSFLHVAGLEAAAAVEAISRDGAGDLWIAVSGDNGPEGILRSHDGRWTDLRGGSPLPPTRCRVMHTDAQGLLWLGFENGEVAVYEGGGFHVYSAKDGLIIGRVLAITDDRARHIWIGGEGGLSRFDGRRFVSLSRANGLPGNSVSGIIEDEGGFLWLAGTLGILRVSPRELDRAFADPAYRMQGTTFDATDGLRGLPRQREPFPTATRAPDGRLWFATTDGMAVIDPRRWPKNVVPPPVTIESIKADDRVLTAFSGVRLRPNTRSVEFRYAALSLAAPERIQFRYRLGGYDDQWHSPVSAREATYTNLPPRHYRFDVVACNNDGIWNDKGATLEFSILPAYYQTSWFFLIASVAAGCLGWACLRWRVSQVRGRQELRFEERLAERARIAQELHDTLLQGFLSASMQLRVAVDGMPSIAPEKPRLNGVLAIMDRVIAEGRNAVRGLRSFVGHDDDLEKAFARMPQELETQGTIDFRVIGNGRARPLRTVVRDEVYRIVREALANAFRHSRAAGVEVEIAFTARHLRIFVRDDGRGIDPQVLQSGLDGHWGLLGMRERAERIGARLRIWSRAGMGAEVELCVPGDVSDFDDQLGQVLLWIAGVSEAGSGLDVELELHRARHRDAERLDYAEGVVDAVLDPVLAADLAQ